MATRYSDNIIDIIKFTARSAVLEDYIISWGYQLLDALYRVSRYDEIEAVHELILEFSALTERYGECVHSFREDISVSLLEACQLRRGVMVCSDNSQEWLHYAADTIVRLNCLYRNRIIEKHMCGDDAMTDIANYRAQTAIDMKRPKVETEYLEENLAYLESQILQ